MRAWAWTAGAGAGAMQWAAAASRPSRAFAQIRRILPKGAAASLRQDSASRMAARPGVAQISCSCGDGLIRPPFEEVGHPEVHGAALQRQHGVGAPLRPARSGALEPQPEPPASALDDAAPGPDAPFPEPVVPHPAEVPLEMPAAGLDFLVPVPEGCQLPGRLRRPARPDVRLASANRRSRSAPGRQDRLAASEARSGQWRRPGTKAAFRPRRAPRRRWGSSPPRRRRRRARPRRAGPAAAPPGRAAPRSPRPPGLRTAPPRRRSGR